MKKIKYILTAFIAILTLNSCTNNDDIEFVAAPQGDFEFTNTFLAEYTLPFETTTNNNIGIVFTFNPANFNVPTNISYELQTSVSGDFTDATMVNSISNNNNNNNTIEVTIGELKRLADEVYGLTAPATRELNFRVRAFPGDTTSSTEEFTPTQTITINLLEQVSSGGAGIEVSPWGVVGSGFNNWGAFPDATFYTTNDADVIVSYVSLVDGQIKFRQNDTWGGDLGDANGDGILDADADNNINVTAGNYKITINLSDNSYTMEEFSWGIVGSGYNDWGNAGPDAKFYYDYTTNTFKVGVRLIDGEIKIRKNNAWSENFGDGNGDGILDTDADNNIAVTAGHYIVTVNFEDNSYTIEENSSIWGIVGSGYNDWGATPDYSLTEVNPGIWYAEGVTLVDGQIKFRPNNEWNGDYGDADSNGVLDQEADNNIDVEAGNYVVRIDFTDPANPAYYLGKR